jgi:hypothetical protein
MVILCKVRIPMADVIRTCGSGRLVLVWVWAAEGHLNMFTVIRGGSGIRDQLEAVMVSM